MTVAIEGSSRDGFLNPRLAVRLALYYFSKYINK